jgi:signal peptidase I
MKRYRLILKRVWNFLWNEDSLASWIVSLLLAFLLVKFMIYPGLGLILGGTTHPVVAVVSGSMEHDGQGFNEWWGANKEWYEEHEIYQEDFNEWIFTNGFNKGDIIFLYGSESKDIKVGDVVVFQSNSQYPIIHRVVGKWSEGDEWYLQTKGDHNAASYSSLGETRIAEDKIIGKSLFKIPYLGWIKILFTNLIGGLVK